MGGIIVNEFNEYVRECFSTVGDIDIKSMMGGYLVYFNGKLVKRTPNIGSFRKNPFRIPLAGGMLWLSIYGAMAGKMNQEQFGEMVNAAIEAPILKKTFQRQKVFDRKAQKKKIEKTRLRMQPDSEFNWNTELILGRDENEYTVIYHRCGLCALGRQEHHEELI